MMGTSKKLTKRQRRELQRLTGVVDRTIEADRKFLERHPHRSHRLRLACAAEVEASVVTGAPPVPPGLRMFVVVRQVAPGAWLRSFRGLEGVDTDVDEATCSAIFERIATPKAREIHRGNAEAVGGGE